MSASAKVEKAKRTVSPSPRKMSLAEHRRRFEELSRELGCDDGQALDKAFSKTVPPKVPQKERT